MKSEAKRFLSIRLSQDEFDKVQHYLQQSTCRSLTEYAKKTLTRQPVTVKVRDQTREDILHELGMIRSLLNKMPGSPDPSKVDPNVMSFVAEIYCCFREIAKKCSQS